MYIRESEGVYSALPTHCIIWLIYYVEAGVDLIVILYKIILIQS